MVVKQKVDEDQALLCGVDLGGTKVVVALVAGNGAVLGFREIRDHRGKPENDTIRRIAALVDSLLADAALGREQVLGIGVGTSGHVDHEGGVVITNSNLPGFSNYPLKEELSAATKLPVSVDNDANAQAYAEYRFGASRGMDINVFVTVSTGIGAGIVIDGRLYRGVTGTAGEIGHTIVNPSSTIRCGCGNLGCLMSHASGLALPQNIREMAAVAGGATKKRIDALPDAELNGEFVRTGFDAGDSLCREIVAKYADYMGIGLYNLFQVLNPGVIVLGGGLTNWGEPYLQGIRNRFYATAGSMMARRTEIRLADLKEHAAVIGAAALVLEQR